MVEWLAIWGVTQAVGFVFKPILEDLAKDAAKDYAKDFFKSSIGNVIKGLNREPLQKATGKAIKEFLELVQQELEDADLDETQLKQYIKPLKQFIKNPDVAKTLGSAFQNEVKVLDTKTLATIGNEIYPSLPNNFNWGRVGKLYLKKAKAIRIESDELRKILDSENLDKLANQNTEIKPEFDLEKYQEGIREQYGNLKLESLDTSGYAYNQLKLWRMFIPQNVRESQEFLPQVHEIPRERKKERLKRAIKDSRAIKELAGNPLLLTMMAILNRHQELPRDRAELYNQASRVLLHQWDMERALVDAKIDPITIDYKDKQAILRHVAHFMQGNIAGLAGNLILGNDLERIISEYLKSIEINDVRTVARALMEQLRSRNFVLCFVGAEYYAFVHRTFLEYFCAREFVWQFEKEQKISKDELIEEVFGQHWQDQTWHEVLRLIAGMIDVKFVGEIISYLMKQDGEKEEFKNLFFAGKCLFEVRSRLVISDVGNQLLDRLKSLVGYDLGYYYGNYYYYSYRNNSKRFNPSNDYEKINLVRKIRTQAVEVVAATWKDERSTYIWLKQLAEFDDDEDVRQEAIEQMAVGWKNEPETLPMLKQWAQFDDDGFVRREAVRQIAMGWKNCPETLIMLKQWAQFDDDGFVRREAVRQIGMGWKNSPETLTMLKQWAQFDDEQFVRRGAIEQIATGWKNCPETLTMLKQRAQFDDDDFVRRGAIEQIATGWKHDPDTLPMLKYLVQFDNDELVRREAIEQIAAGWKHDPETLPMLKQWAQFDDEVVQQEAIKQIATAWKHDSETLPMLKQLVNSYNEDTRQEVVRQMAIHWKGNSEILPIFKHLAKSDDDSDVRQEAVRQIATGWKDHPETLSLLKYLVQSDDNSNVRQDALQQISRGWKPHTETFHLFYNCALNDPFQPQDDFENNPFITLVSAGIKDYNPFTIRVPIRIKHNLYQPMINLISDRVRDEFSYIQPNPRQTALEAIVKQYPNHPQTLPLLQDRAENDPDEQLREWAKKKLRRLES